MRLMIVGIILLSVILISSGLTASVVLLSKYHKVIEYEATISVVEHNNIGFNTENDKIYFGTVPLGGGSVRALKVKNYLDKPVQLEITSKGDIAQFVFFSAQDFVVQPGIEIEFPIEAKIPKDTPLGNYTGTVIIGFKRI